MLIYDLSSEGRTAPAQFERRDGDPLDLPEKHMRKGPIGLPGVSELQAFYQPFEKEFLD